MVGGPTRGCVWPWLAAAALALGAVGCGDDEPADDDDDVVADAGVGTPDADDSYLDLFDPDHVVRVDIELAEADWETLRFQGRTIYDILGGDCLAEPWPKPFTYFPGTVTIDGETIGQVGVRKKGFLGSLSDTKPSFKIKFHEYVAGQTFHGMRRMTLNNARQDPSFLNQCMGYAVFEAAGVPASLCNFARVSINGRDLGLYVHVEGIRKQYIGRRYADDDGNLYEGTISDFRVDWDGTFEQKTNKSIPDRSAIDAMVAVVEGAPDSTLVEQLDPLIDLDEFIDEWATEVLLGHWDGYANNRNNYYLYDDPTTGKLDIIPWGIDAIMRPNGGGLSSVMANGHLARRLYLLPETRDRYVARLRELLDTVWDEDALLAEVDRMELLISPILAETGGLAAYEDSVAGMRTFIASRRAEIEGELAGGPPPWNQPLADPPCFEEQGGLDATFDTLWGTLGGDPFNPGTGTMNLVILGDVIPFTAVGAVAGENQDKPGEAVLALVGLLGDGTAALVYFTLPVEQVAPGARLEIDWSNVFGALYHVPGAGQNPNLVGYFAGGFLELTQAATSDGAPVIGLVDSAALVAPPFAAAAPRLPPEVPAAMTELIDKLR